MTENLKHNLYTKKKLKFNKQGKFKILLFSDIHEGLPFCEGTYTCIERLLTLAEPDFVIINGDTLNGGKIKTIEDLRNYLKIMTKPLESRNIPWVHTWGNHDHKTGIDEALQQAEYEAYENCLSKSAPNISGKSNFVIPIYSSDDSRIAFNVWGLDTGRSMASTGEIIYGKDSKFTFDPKLQNKICSGQSDLGFPMFDQIMWYYYSSLEMEKYNGRSIDSFMCVHIPPWEILALQNNREKCNVIGNIDQRYDLGALNSGLFAACLQRRDVRAICTAHMHENDCTGTYCNITICTDGSISHSAYGGEGRRGGRLFILDENDTSNMTSEMIYADKIYWERELTEKNI